MALGAGRGRILRQLLTESLLLAAIGGGLGVLLAAFGTKAALRVLPETLPRGRRSPESTRASWFLQREYRCLPGSVSGCYPR
jgi:ABC-type antimicrobial peptide transport system permease subunit